MAKPLWREIAEGLIWAVVIALILRTFVIQAFWIPSSSMKPALEPGDRVIVLKFWYSLPRVEPKRGQIVVFKYPIDPKRDFVKRVVGLPGDTIEMRDGRVFINNREIAETYVQNTDNFSMPATEIPENNYYCLGDNRPSSQDSRFWGPVPLRFIRGPAMFRYWPPGRMGVIE